MATMQITSKEKQFVDDFLSTNNAHGSYVKIFGKIPNNKSKPRQLLKKTCIAEYLKEQRLLVFGKSVVDYNDILQILSQKILVEQDLKAVDIYNKMRGYYEVKEEIVDVQRPVVINFGIIDKDTINGQ